MMIYIIYAGESFNYAIEQAVWNATPTNSDLDINIEYVFIRIFAVKDRVAEKRKLHKL
jgi:hypothetical protein